MNLVNAWTRTLLLAAALARASTSAAQVPDAASQASGTFGTCVSFRTAPGASAVSPPVITVQRLDPDVAARLSFALCIDCRMIINLGGTSACVAEEDVPGMTSVVTGVDAALESRAVRRLVRALLGCGGHWRWTSRMLLEGRMPGDLEPAIQEVLAGVILHDRGDDPGARRAWEGVLARGDASASARRAASCWVEHGNDEQDPRAWVEPPAAYKWYTCKKPRLFQQ